MVAMVDRVRELQCKRIVELEAAVGSAADWLSRVEIVYANDREREKVAQLLEWLEALSEPKPPQTDKHPSE